jgi:hypothetical protein
MDASNSFIFIVIRCRKWEGPRSTPAAARLLRCLGKFGDSIPRVKPTILTFRGQVA